MPLSANVRARSSTNTTLLVVALVLAALPGLLAAERGLPAHLLLASMPKDATWVPASEWAGARPTPRGERLSTPSNSCAFARLGACGPAAGDGAPSQPAWDACPVAGGVDERLLNIPPPIPG